MANFDLKNPSTQKAVLSVLLAGGLLGVFFFTHLVPFSFPNQRERLGTLRDEYDKKSADLARARASVADLPRFEAEYDQLHQRWELAAELLPAERQLPAMLRKITLAGQQSGVQFVMFKPAAPKADQYYTEFPVQISVTGGYHQVGSFLAELANLRRIVTVSNVKLLANAKGDATTSAEFTASAYSMNTTPAPAPAAPEPAKKGGDGNARKSS